MKKTLSLIILAVLALSTSVFATDDSGNVAHSAHALWTESFDSAAEMAQSANVVAIGTVSSQQAETRCNLVFTRSTITLDQLYSGAVQDDCLQVVQTGGTLDDLYTPEFDDAPLMELGQAYVLFLKHVDDPDYGEYYRILSGGTGCVPATDVSLSCTDSYSNMLSKVEDTINSPIALYATSTPTYGGSFSNGNVSVYYTTTVSSTMKNNISSTINSWGSKSSTSGVSISTASTTKSSNQIRVFAGKYGDTGWAGHVYNYDADRNYNPSYTYIFALSYVQLNTSKLSASSSTWKYVALHEVGHSLGLKDVSNPSYDTVMSRFFDDVVNSGYTSPRDADFNGLKTLYKK